MASVTILFIVGCCMISDCFAISPNDKSPISPAELKESWTKFVDKVKQHTEMAGQPIADQFVRLIGPLVNAYATKNVNGIMDVFKQYEQQAPGLLPHITNIKVRGAAAKAMSDFQKFREKNPKPTQAQIDEHIRKEHALVEQALKMKTG